MGTVKAQEIIIDEEFRSLLPELDKDTYAALSANIAANGCRDALVLWNGILIDGHNRLRACLENDVPYRTVSKEFASRELVIIWIIANQIARRNLSSMQLAHYRGVHYRADKQLTSNPEGRNYPRESAAVSTEELDGNNYHQANIRTTSQRLAQQYKVSEKTIRTDAKIAEVIDAIGAASPEAKRMILAGDVVIHKLTLKEFASKSPEDIAELAKKIADGSYEIERLIGADSFTGAGASPLADTTDGAAGAAAGETTGATTGSSLPATSSTGTNQAVLSAVTRLTDTFLLEWGHQSASSNSALIKPTLRHFIDALEQHYRQIT